MVIWGVLPSQGSPLNNKQIAQRFQKGGWRDGAFPGIVADNGHGFYSITEFQGNCKQFHVKRPTVDSQISKDLPRGSSAKSFEPSLRIVNMGNQHDLNQIIAESREYGSKPRLVRMVDGIQITIAYHDFHPGFQIRPKLFDFGNRRGIVGIHKHYILTRSFRNATLDSRSLALAPFLQNPCVLDRRAFHFLYNPGSMIAAVVVHDNDFVTVILFLEILIHILQRFSNPFLFVEGWDDY